MSIKSNITSYCQTLHHWVPRIQRIEEEIELYLLAQQSDDTFSGSTWIMSALESIINDYAGEALQYLFNKLPSDYQQKLLQMGESLLGMTTLASDLMFLGASVTAMIENLVLTKGDLLNSWKTATIELQKILPDKTDNSSNLELILDIYDEVITTTSKLRDLIFTNEINPAAAFDYTDIIDKFENLQNSLEALNSVNLSSSEKQNNIELKDIQPIIQDIIYIILNKTPDLEQEYTKWLSSLGVKTSSEYMFAYPVIINPIVRHLKDFINSPYIFPLLYNKTTEENKQTTYTYISQNGGVNNNNIDAIPIPWKTNIVGTAFNWFVKIDSLDAKYPKIEDFEWQDLLSIPTAGNMYTDQRLHVATYVLVYNILKSLDPTPMQSIYSLFRIKQEPVNLINIVTNNPIIDITTTEFNLMSSLTHLLENASSGYLTVAAMNKQYYNINNATYTLASKIEPAYLLNAGNLDTTNQLVLQEYTKSLSYLTTLKTEVSASQTWINNIPNVKSYSNPIEVLVTIIQSLLDPNNSIYHTFNDSEDISEDPLYETMQELLKPIEHALVRLGEYYEAFISTIIYPLILVHFIIWYLQKILDMLSTSGAPAELSGKDMQQSTLLAVYATLTDIVDLINKHSPEEIIDLLIKILLDVVPILGKVLPTSITEDLTNLLNWLDSQPIQDCIKDVFTLLQPLLADTYTQKLIKEKSKSSGE